MEDLYGSTLKERFSPKANGPIRIFGILCDTRYLDHETRPIPGLVWCTHCSNRQKLDSDLKRRRWRNPSWYDDQLRICEEMAIFIERTITTRTSAAGVPYVIVIGRVAPNACSVCYNSLLPGEDYDPPPTLLLLTYHRGFFTFLILWPKAFPAWAESTAEEIKKNSFEGGFRIARKEVIHAAYLDK
ncbi:hypothetical protein SCHPADRAFT_615336 [Schizopora paradoxa]|uniref:Uncharacterized protein n=1 Tax=Schizopora paradoxa TaxID=27342 RepID=A0A0H2R8T0_9AGAM|nr:hypothetical protein SCHPADRAFT_615336 [Schizopora paradoxa]